VRDGLAGPVDMARVVSVCCVTASDLLNSKEQRVQDRNTVSEVHNTVPIGVATPEFSGRQYGKLDAGENCNVQVWNIWINVNSTNQTCSILKYSVGLLTVL